MGNHWCHWGSPGQGWGRGKGRGAGSPPRCPLPPLPTRPLAERRTKDERAVPGAGRSLPAAQRGRHRARPGRGRHCRGGAAAAVAAGRRGSAAASGGTGAGGRRCRRAGERPPPLRRGRRLSLENVFPRCSAGLRAGNSRCPPLPRRRGFSGKCPFPPGPPAAAAARSAGRARRACPEGPGWSLPGERSEQLFRPSETETLHVKYT